MKEICGKCKYHRPVATFSNGDTDWVCVNDESDYCADFTEYEDGCEEFEER